MIVFFFEVGGFKFEKDEEESSYTTPEHEHAARITRTAPRLNISVKTETSMEHTPETTGITTVGGARASTSGGGASEIDSMA